MPRNSKFYRIRRLLFTQRMMFVLLKAVVLIGVFFLLFDLRSTLSNQAEGWSLALPITSRMWLALIIGCIVFLSIVIDIWRLVREYVSSDRVQTATAREFIRSINARQGEYVFILRPFGFDGFLNVPRRRSFLNRLVLPANRTVTVEQIVAREARAVLGHETCAVVQPDAKDLAPGPQYVSCDDNWQTEVALLISRASCVFFVFPPGRGGTPAVAWEIRQALAMLDGYRVVIVLTERARKKRDEFSDVAKLLQTEAGFLDIVAHLDAPEPEDVLLFAPHESFVWYEVRRGFLPRWLTHVGEATYADGARTVLKEVRAVLEHQPLSQRYPDFDPVRDAAGATDQSADVKPAAHSNVIPIKRET